MKHKIINNLLLLLTALIWGCAFVAQSVGMEYIGPFTFNCIRSIMGGLVLLPVIWVMRHSKNECNCRTEKDRKTVSFPVDEKTRENRRELVVGGICCGAALAVASSLQQMGLVYTSPGKAGFITALYILIVPFLGIFLGKKAGIKTWVGVVLAVIGMYFLCITDHFSLSRGDTLVLLCAVAFAVHILLVDHFSPRVNGVCLSCIQFFVCGGICAVAMMLIEQPQIENIVAVWKPLAYAGIFSCGVAYTLQIIAQKNTDPTVASLLLSLESVFSVIAGWLILGEMLSGRELFGCLLVFAALVLAQLPSGT